MIRQLDKSKQMDELMKQNEMLMNALQNANQLLEQMVKGQDPAQPQQQLLQQQNHQNQQNQQQDQQQAPQMQASNQTGQQNSQDNQQENANSPQPKQLANDLLQIKDLVANLEIKTAAYVSNQTNKSLSEKDVVGLVLNVIDGMLDWAADFVNNKGQQ